MEIKFYLINLNWKVSLLRILNVSLFFIPFIFPEWFSTLYGDWNMGIWYIILAVLLLLQVKLIKRYQIIGNIQIDNKKIRIIVPQIEEKVIVLDECDSITIRYNGYKGQPLSNYFLSLPLYTKEGVGSLSLVSDNKTEKYHLLAKTDCAKRLVKLKEVLLSENPDITVTVEISE